MLLRRLLPSAATTASFLPDCIPMTPAEFAFVSSIYTVGALAGALAAGPITSSRGRLPAMRLTSLLFFIGASISTIAGSIPIASLGRFVGGVGAGAATVIVPLYISEIAPPKQRGFLGAATQASINIGILATQVMGFFLSHGGSWRWIMATGIFLSIAQVAGLMVVPESPRWLACVKGDVPAAKRTMQKIRGPGADVNTEIQALRAAEIAANVDFEEQGLLAAGDMETQEPPTTPPLTPISTANPQPKATQSQGHLGFFQVLRDPHSRPAIIAVAGVSIGQQFCGINSIIMYSVSLLADLLPIHSGILTIIISVINLFTTIACSPLPDRLGRKTCLLISVIGQGSSSLALALSIVFGIKILSALSTLFFVGFFAVGLGPVPFILASELVGHEAVGATQSWCLAANYIATFIVAQFFPIVNEVLNNWLGGAGWVYFIFAGSAVFWALFVTWFVPETKGKKDADEVWGRTRRLD
jgi:MFS family permease